MYPPSTAITRYIIEAHKQKVTSIALAVEGEMLASSCLDGNVCLWNSSTGVFGALRRTMWGPHRRGCWSRQPVSSLFSSPHQ